MGASNCSFDAFQIEANGGVGTRRALQPSALSECGKINSRWGIPSTGAIAGAKLQSDLLVAIGNPCAGASGAGIPSRGDSRHDAALRHAAA